MLFAITRRQFPASHRSSVDSTALGWLRYVTRIGALIALAGCGVISNPPRMPLTSFVHLFPDGSKLSLLAVTKSAFESSWKPDGSPTKVRHSNFYLVGKSQNLILLKYTPKGPFDRYYSPFITTIDGDGIIDLQPGEPAIWECERRFNSPLFGSRMSIPISAAVDRWKIFDTSRYANAVRTSGTYLSKRLVQYSSVVNVPFLEQVVGEPVEIKSGEERQKGFYITYTVPPKLATSDISFAAYDRDGNRLESSGTLTGPHSHAAYFRGDRKKVARIDMLDRPIIQFSFDNVETSAR